MCVGVWISGWRAQLSFLLRRKIKVMQQLYSPKDRVSYRGQMWVKMPTLKQNRSKQDVNQLTPRALPSHWSPQCWIKWRNATDVHSVGRGADETDFSLAEMPLLWYLSLKFSCEPGSQRRASWLFQNLEEKEMYKCASVSPHLKNDFISRWKRLSSNNVSVSYWTIG